MTRAADHEPLSLVVFVALAYAVSWLVWLPQVADARGWTDITAWPYLHLLGGLGPMTAAFWVTWWSSGGPGCARLWRRAVAIGSWTWLAVGAFGPVVLFLGGAVIARVLDGAWPDVSRFGATDEYPELGLTVYWLANLVCYGFGEEVGWRGVLLPRLQSRMSALPATAIVAAVWTLWHIPLFSFVDGYVSMTTAGLVGLFFSFFTGALLLTWLYNASHGSLLAVVLFHASLDIVINTPAPSDALQTGMGALITIAGLVVLAQYGPRDLAPVTRQMDHDVAAAARAADVACGA